MITCIVIGKQQFWCMQQQNFKDWNVTFVVLDVEGIEGNLKELAAKRNMKDGTIGPVITWTTEGMLGHVDKLLQIPGMCIHTICYRFYV